MLTISLVPSCRQPKRGTTTPWLPLMSYLEDRQMLESRHASPPLKNKTIHKTNAPSRPTHLRLSSPPTRSLFSMRMCLYMCVLCVLVLFLVCCLCVCLVCLHVCAPLLLSSLSVCLHAACVCVCVSFCVSRRCHRPGCCRIASVGWWWRRCLSRQHARRALGGGGDVGGGGVQQHASRWVVVVVAAVVVSV